MPTYLPAPVLTPAGPTRTYAQCARRPLSYAALAESQDSRRARWGGFGPCPGAGACDVCPLTAAEPTRLRSFEPVVLVRLPPGPGGDPHQPHVMNNPTRGWDSSSQAWSWEDLARLEGWRVGRAHRDEHGEGFWLHATTSSDGVYG